MIVIVCSKCGTHNEATAEFCGGCGSFLEYTGTKVDDGLPAPAGSAGAFVAPAAPPLPPAPAPVQPPPVSPTAAVSEPAAVRPGVPAPSAGTGPAPDDQPLQRRPTDEVPHPVRPATTVTQVPVVLANPGDIICANCHTPNDPSRHFCRACGKPLVAAPPVAKLPWWRRLFARKPAEPPAAGTRSPGQKEARRSTGAFGRTLRSIVGLVFVVIVTFGLAGYIAVPSVQSLINKGIKEFMRNFEAPIRVFPTGASGDQIAGQPPGLTQDGSHNQYWAGPTSGSLPKIRFTFNQPTDVVMVIVTPGAEDDLNGFARPKELVFTFSDGTVLTTPLADASLVDDPSGRGPKIIANQQFSTNARDVTSVTVEVRSLYQGTRPAVAIAELQFFTKP